MPSDSPRLRELEDRQRQLARQILDLGFVQQGTVVHRPTRCQTPGCRCHADPPLLHGPYWQLTRYAAGRTKTRRLTEREASLYREWIANRRHLDALVAEMEKVGDEAARLLLERSEPDRRLRKARKPTT